MWDSVTGRIIQSPPFSHFLGFSIQPVPLQTGEKKSIIWPPAAGTSGGDDVNVHVLHSTSRSGITTLLVRLFCPFCKFFFGPCCQTRISFVASAQPY